MDRALSPLPASSRQAPSRQPSSKSKPKKSNNTCFPKKHSSTPFPKGPLRVPEPTPYVGDYTEPTSDAIPISAWNPIENFSFVNASRPTFEPDSVGYMDLVHIYYQKMTSEIESSKRIPRSLFTYCCSLAWWARVLHVHTSNGYTLPADLRDIYTCLCVIGDFNLPAPIAQHLCGIGNFTACGATFYLKLPNHDFCELIDTDGAHLTTLEGFLRTDAADKTAVLDSEDFWIYNQYPIMGVITNNICNEYHDNYNQDPTIPRRNLNAIAPEPPDDCTVHPTANINGWEPSDTLHFPALGKLHTSLLDGTPSQHLPTFKPLSISHTLLFLGYQTRFVISPI